MRVKQKDYKYEDANREAVDVHSGVMNVKHACACVFIWEGLPDVDGQMGASLRRREPCEHILAPAFHYCKKL